MMRHYIHNTMDKKTAWFAGIFVVVVIGLLVVSKAVSNNSGPTNLSGFAQCLKESGATFYGAFWCPHCAAQKALFGTAVKELPYVECSNPDGNSQTQICIDKKIETYPTWEFKDGSRLTGEIPLATLASTTSCVLPQ